MTAAYKNIITTYLSNVAQASGRTNNVYSTATNIPDHGEIRYRIRWAPPLTTQARCPRTAALASTDTTGSTGTALAITPASTITRSLPRPTGSSLRRAFRRTSRTSTCCSCRSTSSPASSQVRRTPRPTSARSTTSRARPTAPTTARLRAAPSTHSWPTPSMRRRRGSPAVATPCSPLSKRQRGSRRQHRGQPHEPRGNGGVDRPGHRDRLV